MNNNPIDSDFVSRYLEASKSPVLNTGEETDRQLQIDLPHTEPVSTEDPFTAAVHSMGEGYESSQDMSETYESIDRIRKKEEDLLRFGPRAGEEWTTGDYLWDWRSMYQDIWKEDPDKWSTATDVAGKALWSVGSTAFQGLGTVLGFGTSVPSGIYESIKKDDWRFLARNVLNGRGWGDIYIENKIKKNKIGSTVLDEFASALAREIFLDPLTYATFGLWGGVKAIGKGGDLLKDVIKTTKYAKKIKDGVEYTLSAEGVKQYGKFIREGMTADEASRAVGSMIEMADDAGGVKYPNLIRTGGVQFRGAAAPITDILGLFQLGGIVASAAPAIAEYGLKKTILKNGALNIRTAQNFADLARNQAAQGASRSDIERLSEMSDDHAIVELLGLVKQGLAGFGGYFGEELVTGQRLESNLDWALNFPKWLGNLNMRSQFQLGPIGNARFQGRDIPVTGGVFADPPPHKIGLKSNVFSKTAELIKAGTIRKLHDANNSLVQAQVDSIKEAVSDPTGSKLIERERTLGDTSLAKFLPLSNKEGGVVNRMLQFPLKHLAFLRSTGDLDLDELIVDYDRLRMKVFNQERQWNDGILEQIRIEAHRRYSRNPKGTTVQKELDNLYSEVLNSSHVDLLENNIELTVHEEISRIQFARMKREVEEITAKHPLEANEERLKTYNRMRDELNSKLNDQIPGSDQAKKLEKEIEIMSSVSEQVRQEIAQLAKEVDALYEPYRVIAKTANDMTDVNPAGTLAKVRDFDFNRFLNESIQSYIPDTEGVKLYDAEGNVVSDIDPATGKPDPEYGNKVEGVLKARYRAYLEEQVSRGMGELNIEDFDDRVHHIMTQGAMRRFDRHRQNAKSKTKPFIFIREMFGSASIEEVNSVYRNGKNLGDFAAGKYKEKIWGTPFELAQDKGLADTLPDPVYDAEDFRLAVNRASMEILRERNEHLKDPRHVIELSDETHQLAYSHTDDILKVFEEGGVGEDTFRKNLQILREIDKDFNGRVSGLGRDFFSTDLPFVMNMSNQQVVRSHSIYSMFDDAITRFGKSSRQLDEEANGLVPPTIEKIISKVKTKLDIVLSEAPVKRVLGSAEDKLGDHMRPEKNRVVFPAIMAGLGLTQGDDEDSDGGLSFGLAAAMGLGTIKIVDPKNMTYKYLGKGKAVQQLVPIDLKKSVYIHDSVFDEALGNNSYNYDDVRTVQNELFQTIRVSKSPIVRDIDLIPLGSSDDVHNLDIHKKGYTPDAMMIDLGEDMGSRTIEDVFYSDILGLDDEFYAINEPAKDFRNKTNHILSAIDDGIVRRGLEQLTKDLEDALARSEPVSNTRRNANDTDIDFAVRNTKLFKHDAIQELIDSMSERLKNMGVLNDFYRVEEEMLKSNPFYYTVLKTMSMEDETVESTAFNMLVHSLFTSSDRRGRHLFKDKVLRSGFGEGENINLYVQSTDRIPGNSLQARNDHIHKQYKGLWRKWGEQNPEELEDIRLSGYDLQKSPGAYRLNIFNSGHHSSNVGNKKTGISTWKPPIDVASETDEMGSPEHIRMSGMILKTGKQRDDTNLSDTRLYKTQGHTLMPEFMLKDLLEETMPVLKDGHGPIGADTATSLYSELVSMYREFGFGGGDYNVPAQDLQKFRVKLKRLLSLGNAAFRQSLGDSELMEIHNPQGKGLISIREHLETAMGPKGNLGKVEGNLPSTMDDISGNMAFLSILQGLHNKMFKSDNWLFSHERGPSVQRQTDQHLAGLRRSLIESDSAEESMRFPEVREIESDFSNITYDSEGPVFTINDKGLHQVGRSQTFDLDVYGGSLGQPSVEQRYARQVINTRNRWYGYIDELLRAEEGSYDYYLGGVVPVRPSTSTVISNSLTLHNRLIDFANDNKIYGSSIVDEARRIVYELIGPSRRRYEGREGRRSLAGLSEGLQKGGKIRTDFLAHYNEQTGLPDFKRRSTGEEIKDYRTEDVKPGQLWKLEYQEMEGGQLGVKGIIDTSAGAEDVAKESPDYVGVNLGDTGETIQEPMYNVAELKELEGDESVRVHNELVKIITDTLFDSTQAVKDDPEQYTDLLADAIQSMDVTFLSQELFHVAKVDPKDIIGNFNNQRDINISHMAALEEGVPYIHAGDTRKRIRSIITDATHGSAQGASSSGLRHGIKIGGVVPLRFDRSTGEIVRASYSRTAKSMLNHFEIDDHFETYELGDVNVRDKLDRATYENRKASDGLFIPENETLELKDAHDPSNNPRAEDVVQDITRGLEDRTEVGKTYGQVGAEAFKELEDRDLSNIDTIFEHTILDNVSYNDLTVDARSNPDTALLLNTRLGEDALRANIRKSNENGKGGTIIFVDQPDHKITEQIGDENPFVSAAQRIIDEEPEFEDQPYIILDRSVFEVPGGETDTTQIRRKAMKVRNWLKDNGIHNIHVSGSTSYYSPGSHLRGKAFMDMILSDDDFRTLTTDWFRSTTEPDPVTGNYPKKPAIVDHIHGDLKKNGLTGLIGYKEFTTPEGTSYTNVNAEYLFVREVMGIQDEQRNGSWKFDFSSPDSIDNTLIRRGVTKGVPIDEDKLMSRLNNVKGKPGFTNPSTGEVFAGKGIRMREVSPDGFATVKTGLLSNIIDELKRQEVIHPDREINSYLELSPREKYDVYNKFYEDVYDDMFADVKALSHLTPYQIGGAERINQALRSWEYKVSDNEYRQTDNPAAKIVYSGWNYMLDDNHGSLPTNPRSQVPKDALTDFVPHNGGYMQDPIIALDLYMKKNHDVLNKLSHSKWSGKGLPSKFSNKKIVRIKPPSVKKVKMNDGKEYTYLSLPEIKAYLERVGKEGEGDSIYPSGHNDVTSYLNAILEMNNKEKYGTGEEFALESNALLLNAVGNGMENDFFRMVSSVAPNHRGILFGDDKTFDLLKQMIDGPNNNRRRFGLNLMASIGTDKMVIEGAKNIVEHALGYGVTPSRVEAAIYDKYGDLGEIKPEAVIPAKEYQIPTGDVTEYDNAKAVNYHILEEFVSTVDGLHRGRLDEDTVKTLDSSLERIKDGLTQSIINDYRKAIKKASEPTPKPDPDEIHSRLTKSYKGLREDIVGEISKLGEDLKTARRIVEKAEAKVDRIKVNSGLEGVTSPPEELLDSVRALKAAYASFDNVESRYNNIVRLKEKGAQYLETSRRLVSDTKDPSSPIEIHSITKINAIKRGLGKAESVETAKENPYEMLHLAATDEDEAVGVHAHWSLREALNGYSMTEIAQGREDGSKLKIMDAIIAGMSSSDERVANTSKALVAEKWHRNSPYTENENTLVLRDLLVQSGLNLDDIESEDFLGSKKYNELQDKALRIEQHPFIEGAANDMDLALEEVNYIDTYADPTDEALDKISKVEEKEGSVIDQLREEFNVPSATDNQKLQAAAPIGLGLQSYLSEDEESRSWSDFALPALGMSIGLGTIKNVGKGFDAKGLLKDVDGSDIPLDKFESEIVSATTIKGKQNIVRTTITDDLLTHLDFDDDLIAENFKGQHMVFTQDINDPEGGWLMSLIWDDAGFRENIIGDVSDTDIIEHDVKDISGTPIATEHDVDQWFRKEYENKVVEETDLNTGEDVGISDFDQSVERQQEQLDKEKRLFELDKAEKIKFMLNDAEASQKRDITPEITQGLAEQKSDYDLEREQFYIDTVKLDDDAVKERHQQIKTQGRQRAAFLTRDPKEVASSKFKGSMKDDTLELVHKPPTLDVEDLTEEDVSGFVKTGSVDQEHEVLSLADVKKLASEKKARQAKVAEEEGKALEQRFRKQQEREAEPITITDKETGEEVWQGTFDEYMDWWIKNSDDPEAKRIRDADEKHKQELKALAWLKQKEKFDAKERLRKESFQVEEDARLAAERQGRHKGYKGKPLIAQEDNGTTSVLPNSWVGPDGDVWSPVRLPDGSYLDNSIDDGMGGGPQLALFPQVVRQELERALNTMHNPHEMGKFLKMYDEVFGFYKKYTLFPFPSYLFRNLMDSTLWKGWLMGNTDSRNYVKGMDLAKYRRAKGKEKERLREKVGKVAGLNADQIENLAVEYGAIRDSVVADELGITNSNMLGFKGGTKDYGSFLDSIGVPGKYQGHLLDFADDTMRNGYQRPQSVSAEGSAVRGAIEDMESWLSDKGSVGKAVKKVASVAGGVGRGVSYIPRKLGSKLAGQGMIANDFLEDSLRFSGFVDSLNRGLNAEQAADRVKLYHFDYTDSSELFKTIPSRLFPWINWTARNVPLHMKMKYGGAHHKFLPFYKAMDMWEASDPFGDADNIDPKYMAAFMRDNLPIRVGKDKEGNPTYALMGMMFDTVEAQNLEMDDLGPMAVQMMSPFLRMPIEQIMNYDFLRRQQLAKYSGETGEFFGVRMSKRAIRGLKEVRFLSQAHSLAKSPDEWYNVFVGKNLYSYNPSRSKRYHDYKKLNKTSMHPKYSDWVDANSLLSLPDDNRNVIKPIDSFRSSRELAQVEDTMSLLRGRIRKVYRANPFMLSDTDRGLIDEYENGLKEMKTKKSKIQSKIRSMRDEYR